MLFKPCIIAVSKTEFQFRFHFSAIIQVAATRYFKQNIPEDI